MLNVAECAIAVGTTTGAGATAVGWDALPAGDVGRRSAVEGKPRTAPAWRVMNAMKLPAYTSETDREVSRVH